MRSAVGLRCTFRCQRQQRQRLFHSTRLKCENVRSLNLNSGEPSAKSFSEAVGKPVVLRPVLVSRTKILLITRVDLNAQFFLGVSGISFYAAAKLTNADTEYWTKRLTATNPTWHWLGGFPNAVTSAEMHKARIYTFVEVRMLLISPWQSNLQVRTSKSSWKTLSAQLWASLTRYVMP